MTAADINNKQPLTVNSRIAESGDYSEINQSATTNAVSVATGFPSIYSTPRAENGKSVSRKDMNGLLRLMSSLNYYYQFMGRNPWRSGWKYPKGALVWVYDSSDGGGEYVCITDNQSGTTSPKTDTTNWKKIGTATGLVVDKSAIKTSVESIIDTKLTKSYLEGKLGYHIVITSTSPSTYAADTLYFITGT